MTPARPEARPGGRILGVADEHLVMAPPDGASGDLPARGREEDARLRDALDEAHRQIDALRAQVEEMTARHESLMRHSNDVTVVTAEDTTMTYASRRWPRCSARAPQRGGAGWSTSPTPRTAEPARGGPLGRLQRQHRRGPRPVPAPPRTPPASPRCSRTRATTTPWAAWCGTCAT